MYNTHHSPPIPRSKMANSVGVSVESAFKELLRVTEESKNLRHDLKQDIVKSVSELRKAFSSLNKELLEKETEINELKNSITLTRQQRNTLQTTPSPGGVRELPPSLKEDLPSSAKNRYYSEVAAGQTIEMHHNTFKLFVKSKNNQSIEYIKTLLKTKVNPVEMKVGINSLKSLKNGQLLIESGNKQEAETICKTINNKCGEELEANVTRKRNPRIILFNVPEDITVDNCIGCLTTQNEVLKKHEKGMVPIFAFVDRKKNRNLVIELSSEARKDILGIKIKMGWNMCNWDDYVNIRRCFKCCKYNHRAQESKGTLNMPRVLR